MHLLEYPGNVYRNLHKGKAEFIEHRLGTQYRGCVVELGVDRMVATDPTDRYPESCTICAQPVAWNEGLCDYCHLLLHGEETLDTSLL